jgi:hypothetical protein
MVTLPLKVLFAWYLAVEKSCVGSSLCWTSHNEGQMKNMKRHYIVLLGEFDELVQFLNYSLQSVWDWPGLRDQLFAIFCSGYIGGIIASFIF